MIKTSQLTTPIKDSIEIPNPSCYVNKGEEREVRGE